MFYDIYLNDFYEFMDERIEYKTSLSKYTKKEIENFKGGKITIAYNKIDILNFTKLPNKSNNDKLYFGKINSTLAIKIYNDINLYLKDYNFSLQRNSLKHILNHHGEINKETKRGQKEIIKNDFLLLPELLTNYDKISLSHKVECNNISFIIEKQIRNLNYILICYVSNKRHTIEVKTLYKIKRTLPLGI